NNDEAIIGRSNATGGCAVVTLLLIILCRPVYRYIKYYSYMLPMNLVASEIKALAKTRLSFEASQFYVAGDVRLIDAIKIDCRVHDIPSRFVVEHDDDKFTINNHGGGVYKGGHGDMLGHRHLKT
ncbi:hypothetical protein ACJX0J_026985, partial [Zea mays]